MRTDVTVSDLRDAVEQYDIQRRIDEEGQKFVFAGQSADGPIAVKAIAVDSADAADDGVGTMEPVVDATASSLVDTRNVFAVPHDDRWLFVKVEEFVPGRTLRELLDERGPGLELGLLVATRLLKAARALAAVHTPHYDVKPRNVRITPDGRLYLVDVSAIRRLEAKGLTSESGADAIGPMSYSAPEQRDRPLSDWDARVDLFSIGATTVEAAAGVRPVDAPDFDSFSVARPSPSAELDGVDFEAFESVLSRLTASDPDDRFDGPRDALAALERAVGEDANHHLETATIE